MVNKYAVIITNDTSEEAKVILRNSREEACKLLEILYYECLFNMKTCDFDNTYIEEDSSYSQIVDGLETTKFYVTEVKKVIENQR